MNPWEVEDLPPWEYPDVEEAKTATDIYESEGMMAPPSAARVSSGGPVKIPTAIEAEFSGQKPGPGTFPSTISGGFFPPIPEGLQTKDVGQAMPPTEVMREQNKNRRWEEQIVEEADRRRP